MNNQIKIVIFAETPFTTTSGGTMAVFYLAKYLRAKGVDVKIFNEGRSEKFYKQDDLEILGWNMYMTPVEAAQGLFLLQNYPDVVQDDVELGGYKDLTKFAVFKNYKTITSE